jgi:calpain-7
VLSRAEKVKKRVESLGGSVGKVVGDDAAEEENILRRGGGMNGLKLDLWSVPSHRDFESAGGTLKWREEEEPDMPDVDVVWSDIGTEEWDCAVDRETKERWVVRQGTGADCSVAAGLGVSLEHNRLWGTRVRRNQPDRVKQH